MNCLETILPLIKEFLIKIGVFVLLLLNHIIVFLDRYLSVNTNLISIYGIIFTIIIGIIFYVYSKNGVERKVLQNGTRINKIIIYSLIYFILGFILLPRVLFFVLNGYFILRIIYLSYKAFKFIQSFYETVISDKKITEDYVKKNIKDNISKYYQITDENNKLNDEIDSLGNVTRFLSEDSYDEYTLIKSEKNGYIEKIDLDIFRNVNLKKLSEKQVATSVQDTMIERGFIYIPFTISKGVQISEGDILYGVKKGAHISKNAIRITSENFFPVQDFLDVVLEDKFNEIFSYIKEGNYKFVEKKLNESAIYINFVFDEEKFNANIIGAINNEFLLPLQEEAFKREDFRVLREVSSFSLKYLYKSIDQKSKDKFEIFIGNLTTSFFYSLELKDEKTKKIFHEILNHWLYELFEYSLKSRLIKNKKEDENFYLGAIERVFVALNSMLKYSYDKNDLDSLKSVLYLTKSVFAEKTYERSDSKLVSSLKQRKESVMFGFTSCVYRDMRNKGIFDEHILKELYDLIPKDLTGLLKSASGALMRSENSKFNWDNLSWSNQGGYLGIRSGTITTDSDVIILLVDRLFYGLRNGQINKLDFSKDIDNELLAIYSQIKDLKITDINSCAGMTDENFLENKNKIEHIFKQIKTNYEERVENELIEQKINIEKVRDYANKNFTGYKKNALLRSIALVSEIETGLARGYNQLFYKERFVDKTNLHITDDDTFGESLARSEDNYLLEKIIKTKKTNIKEVDLKDLGKLLKEKSSSFQFALIWAKNHIFLEDTAQDSNFIPRWQINESDLKIRGFQGKVNDMEVYNVYPLREVAGQVDAVFFINKNDIALNEFQPKKEDKSGTYTVSSEDNHLEFSIRNLSELDDEELAKVKVNPKPPKDLKSKVILQLYKGFELGNTTKFDSIDVYKIKR